ncbi:MAG: DUF1893 domain-containing protein [Dehalococcoidia bacterium]|nr:DUF1893 domain-containing protein [Dehalococcoidia bacterium]
MYQRIFSEFTASDDTLRVYEVDRLVFSSRKDRLLPLMEYIDRFAPDHRGVVIFDKIIGNAAALLAVKAGGREVFSPLGSELAVKTLGKYGVAYHFTRTAPNIQRADGEDMCPMEKLSIGKEPDEFYREMVAIISKSAAKGS